MRITSKEMREAFKRYPTINLLTDDRGYPDVYHILWLNIAEVKDLTEYETNSELNDAADALREGKFRSHRKSLLEADNKFFIHRIKADGKTVILSTEIKYRNESVDMTADMARAHSLSAAKEVAIVSPARLLQHFGRTVDDSLLIKHAGNGITPPTHWDQLELYP